MSNPVQVSVVVPSYNYAHFLPAALDSVIAQTYAGWECIIVDDGSTDDTAAVAGEYVRRDPRFRYLHQANLGLAGARNTGVRNARGDAIQFLDADDRLLPPKLERHAAYLASHPECDIVYGDVWFFRSETPDLLTPSLHGKLSRSILRRVHGNAESFRILQHYNIMPVPAAVVRRRVFERAMFDEEANAVEDYGFWIRCAALGFSFDFCEPDEPVAAVRSHGASMSRDFVRMLRGLITVAHAYENTVPPITPRLPLIYDMALGVEMAERQSRMRGARRIWRAAAAATEPLTAMRWRVYALATLLLPQHLFLRVIATPIPEGPYAFYRKLSGIFRKRRSATTP